MPSTLAISCGSGDRCNRAVHRCQTRKLRRWKQRALHVNVGIHKAREEVDPLDLLGFHGHNRLDAPLVDGELGGEDRRAKRSTTNPRSRTLYSIVLWLLGGRRRGQNYCSSGGLSRYIASMSSA
jgi:hypothetical protein